MHHDIGFIGVSGHGDVVRRAHVWNALALAAALSLAGGCGEQAGKAPAPPNGKARLTLDYFSALDRHDHQAALLKIQRLRQLAPNDVDLIKLEEHALDNRDISLADKSLARGSATEAVGIVEASIRSRGQQPALVAAAGELDMLAQLGALLARIRAPNDATDLARSVGKLNQLIAKNKLLAGFRPYADRRLADAGALLDTEKRRSLADVAAELDAAWVRGDPALKTIAAVIAAEDADAPEAKAYAEALGPSWKTTVFNPSMLADPAAETAFFRMALASQDAKAKAAFRELDSMPPGDLRNCLVRAAAAHELGDEERAERLARELDDNARLPDKSSKRWATFVLRENLPLSSLNPFVLYPFPIYRTGTFSKVVSE